jgi:eukaryotic-like serine/threonine-protein kinase
MTDLIGQQFGSYRLVRRLGVGGFASVYLGQHVRISSKQAAIKILDLRDVNVQNFQQEAETTERLVHPHIVRLLDFDIQGGTPFLVLDYAPNGSLRACHPKGSQVPLDVVIEYLKELAPALQYAHDQQILHRDIKPDNILIGRQGELLLSDFGIALLLRTGKTSAQGSTNTGGTPAYMAPEQFRGRPEKASDQYALAVVVYEWLTGHVPFSEGDFIQLGYQHTHEPVPPLLRLAPTLPVRVAQVVEKALCKLPQDRFPTVLSFVQALDIASAALPTVSSPLHPASSEVHEGIRYHSGESSPVKEDISLSPISAMPSPPTKADQPLSMEKPTVFSSSSSSAGNEALLTPVPRFQRGRRGPGKQVLFTLAVALLIALSGSGLYSFWFTARPPTLSPAQTTATASAQEYNTVTAKQGVMFGFDAARTNNNPYEHILSPANISQVKPLWNFATGSYISSSPVVAGGMVYVGSEDRNLYAFDAMCRKNCQPLWSFASGMPEGYLGGITSSPAVAGGMVYVGSRDKKLYAFDAMCRKNCQPLWSFTTESDITSSPAVAGGMVYVGSEDRNLYAFDAMCRKNCQPLWSFTTEGHIESSPAVAGGMVYVRSEDGNLYAFDATCRKNCQPLWSFTTGGLSGGITSSPAVAGGMVYVGSSNGLYAFDATCRNACQPLWSFASGMPEGYLGGITSSPAVAGGMVYVGSGDRLYAFDATCRRACQPLWNVVWIISLPAVAGGMVYVGSGNRLHAFDVTCRKDCLPLRSFATGDWITSSPVVADGMVYVGSRDKKLYAFGLTA